LERTVEGLFKGTYTSGLERIGEDGLVAIEKVKHGKGLTIEFLGRRILSAPEDRGSVLTTRGGR